MLSYTLYLNLNNFSGPVTHTAPLLMHAAPFLLFFDFLVSCAGRPFRPRPTKAFCMHCTCHVAPRCFFDFLVSCAGTAKMPHRASRFSRVCLPVGFSDFQKGRDITPAFWCGFHRFSEVFMRFDSFSWCFVVCFH